MKIKATLLALALASGVTLTANAQSYQFYNQYGQSTGSARSNYNGGYNFYNQFGQQTGSARPNYNGGYDFYNSFGQQTGSQRRGW
jgi:hypothetical protein